MGFNSNYCFKAHFWEIDYINVKYCVSFIGVCVCVRLVMSWWLIGCSMQGAICGKKQRGGMLLKNFFFLSRVIA